MFMIMMMMNAIALQDDNSNATIVDKITSLSL